MYYMNKKHLSWPCRHPFSTCQEIFGVKTMGRIMGLCFVALQKNCWAVPGKRLANDLNQPHWKNAVPLTLP